MHIRPWGSRLPPHLIGIWCGMEKYYRGGTIKTTFCFEASSSPPPMADLASVSAVRSCHGPPPWFRPHCFGGMAIGLVLEMRQKTYNYLEALQYSMCIILAWLSASGLLHGRFLCCCLFHQSRIGHCWCSRRSLQLDVRLYDGPI